MALVALNKIFEAWLDHSPLIEEPEPSKMTGVSVAFGVTAMFIYFMLNGGFIRRIFGSLVISAAVLVYINSENEANTSLIEKEVEMALKLNKVIEQIHAKLTFIRAIILGTIVAVTYLISKKGFSKIIFCGLVLAGGLTALYFKTKNELKAAVIELAEIEAGIIQIETSMAFGVILRDITILLTVVCSIATLIIKQSERYTMDLDSAHSPHFNLRNNSEITREQDLLRSRMLNDQEHTRGVSSLDFRLLNEELAPRRIISEQEQPYVNFARRRSEYQAFARVGALLDEDEEFLRRTRRRIIFEQENARVAMIEPFISRIQVKHHPIPNLSIFRQRSLHQEECTICFDPVCAICPTQQKVIFMLSCGHIFHEQCIMNWLQNKNDCPTCRSRNVAVENVTERCIHQDNYGRKRKRRQRQKNMPNNTG